MIKVVQGYQRIEYSGLFDQMFAQRKRIFADQKQWDVTVIDGKYEIDAFDRDDTVYVLSLSASGVLSGSVRLINTTLDHMASNVFDKMFPGLSIRSPTIWEATRFAVPPNKRVQPNGVSYAGCEVLLGMCLFGLSAGVSQMTAIYEASMGRVYRRCGLSNIVLAKHRTADHGTIEFGLWDISRQLESSIRSATDLIEPVGDEVFDSVAA